MPRCLPACLGNGPLSHNLRSVELQAPPTKISVNRSHGYDSIAHDIFQKEVLQGSKLFPADDRHRAVFSPAGLRVKAYVEPLQISLTLRVEFVAMEWQNVYEKLETSIQAVGFCSLSVQVFHPNNYVGGGVE